MHHSDKGTNARLNSWRLLFPVIKFNIRSVSRLVYFSFITILLKFYGEVLGSRIYYAWKVVIKLKSLNYLIKVVISSNSVYCFEFEGMKSSVGVDYSMIEKELWTGCSICCYYFMFRQKIFIDAEFDKILC